MIRGLGIDILETERMAAALARRGRRFLERVFTELELRQCHDRADRVQALAARFAAKEACLKALGTGWSGGLALSQVEVVRTDGGRPELRLHGAAAERAKQDGVTGMHVSLSHQPGVVAAVVVLEAGGAVSPGGP